VPKVSVIVPFYNAAATLDRCLASLTERQSGDYEVLCVDDRSTDESAEIAMRYPVRLVQMIRRSGAAAARNLAASMAVGEIFFFVDADVFVPPGLVAAVDDRFAADATLDAVFGAYTILPAADNFTSVYKNFVHHYTHLTSHREASTFWCGCGAIRRAAFALAGGFAESYTAASVEDIELGYRLQKRGGHIRLDPSLRVVHAKHYTLGRLVRSDLLDRAIPWTKLMARENIFKLDLNLKIGNVVSGIVLALFLPLGLTALLVWPLADSWPLLAVALVSYLALNAGITTYVWRVMGACFALLFLVMYSITYLYSVLGFVLGLLLYSSEKARRR
jgi:glycosyltransferase involved in cell wall biosynthesis